MIAHETGRTYRPRFRPEELRENEVRADAAQGPVPACLLPGYQPPPKVVSVPDAPRVCAQSPPPASKPAEPKRAALKPSRATRAGHPAIMAALAGGVWRTVRELARETGLEPKAVRLAVQRMRLPTRAVAIEEMDTRDGLLEYALPEPPAAP